MRPPDIDSVARPTRLSRRADWAGRGSIINALMARALAQPDLISLAAGFVDQQTLPAEPARRAFAALAAEEARMQSALQYGTTIGYPPLRETLVERLLAADGQTAASPERLRDRVVLTAGSNELLYLVSDILSTRATSSSVRLPVISFIWVCWVIWACGRWASRATRRASSPPLSKRKCCAEGRRASWNG